jgi:hypothetical protein
MMVKNKNGSIYILTLAASIVLVATVLALSTNILQFRRSSRSNTQIEQARIYAELGIRHALRFTNTEPTWRQILSNGLWMQNVPNGDATYSVTGMDPIDADLANNSTDPVILTSTATVHGLSRTIQVEAIEEKIPCELLKYALAAGTTINISNRVVINGNVTSNGNISKTGGSTIIYGDAEAVGTIADTQGITGVISPGSEPKEFPDTVAILQYYKSLATDIPFQATIEKVMLSPTSNPFGPANPDGLYRINCDNQKITISDCRIVGTLLLISPRSDSTIESGINWTPARPGYPALIVDSDITICPDRTLDEHSLGVDFSMSGELGNGSIVNVYPNLIQGMIYCDGILSLGKQCNILGTVIATIQCLVVDDTIINWNPSILDNPPPKFYDGCLVPAQGTWRQITPKQ